MDYFKNHPLERITHNQNLSMLECLIPFIDYPFNLYLAIYIKFSEIHLIMSVFSSKESMLRYGLHNSEFSIENIISSFTGFSPDNIKLIMEMMKDQNMFSNDIMSTIQNGNMSVFSDLFKSSVENNTKNSSPNTNDIPPSPPTSFEDNFQKLLAEYDMMEAAQLKEQSPDTDSAYNETNAIN